MQMLTNTKELSMSYPLRVLMSTLDLTTSQAEIVNLLLENESVWNDQFYIPSYRNHIQYIRNKFSVLFGRRIIQSSKGGEFKILKVDKQRISKYIKDKLTSQRDENG